MTAAPRWESSALICTLAAAIVAGVVFAIFELVALQRRLRHARLRRNEARLVDVAAAIAAVGLLGGAVSAAALLFRDGPVGKARPMLLVGSSIAGALLIFVIVALGCDQRQRCKARHSLGSDKTVGLLGLVSSLIVVAAATVRLKHCWYSASSAPTPLVRQGPPS